MQTFLRYRSGGSSQWINIFALPPPWVMHVSPPPRVAPATAVQEAVAVQSVAAVPHLLPLNILFLVSRCPQHLCAGAPRLSEYVRLPSIRCARNPTVAMGLFLSRQGAHTPWTAMHPRPAALPGSRIQAIPSPRSIPAGVVVASWQADLAYDARHQV